MSGNSPNAAERLCRIGGCMLQTVQGNALVPTSGDVSLSEVALFAPGNLLYSHLCIC